MNLMLFERPVKRERHMTRSDDYLMATVTTECGLTVTRWESGYHLGKVTCHKCRRIVFADAERSAQLA